MPGREKLLFLFFQSLHLCITYTVVISFIQLGNCPNNNVLLPRKQTDLSVQLTFFIKPIRPSEELSLRQWRKPKVCWVVKILFNWDYSPQQRYWSGLPFFPPKELAQSLVAKSVKNLPAMKETEIQPWSRKIKWRRKRQLTSVFLPGKSHGPRILTGYSPWSHKGWTWLSDYTTTTTTTYYMAA